MRRVSVVHCARMHSHATELCSAVAATGAPNADLSVINFSTRGSGVDCKAPVRSIGSHYVGVMITSTSDSALQLIMLTLAFASSSTRDVSSVSAATTRFCTQHSTMALGKRCAQSMRAALVRTHWIDFLPMSGMTESEHMARVRVSKLSLLQSLRTAKMTKKRSCGHTSRSIYCKMPASTRQTLPS